MPPNLLPVNQLLREYCNSSNFLTNDVWKIAFSPCSQYLAIPKQDIDDQYCVLVMKCSNWNTNLLIDNDLSVHNQFTCTSAICSLAFGRRTLKPDFVMKPTLLDSECLTTPKPRREILNRRRSSLTVNRRHDFTKNLFLAAGLADGKINIWNIDTGELTLILKDHQSTVCGLDFTSCTMQLASCSHDTTIKLWDLIDDGKRKYLNEAETIFWGKNKLS